MPPSLSRRWLAIAIGGSAAVLAAGIAALILFMPSGSSSTPVDETYTEIPTSEPSSTPRPPTATPASVLGTPTPIPTPPVYIAPISRIRIPSIDVDAPVTVKGIDASNTMESPDGPEDVAWYDFTAKNGLGAGNAVYSGHLDYINYGKAVFGDIEKLIEGDLIEVVLEDGTVVQFAVTAVQVYGLNDIPMEEVLAPTSTESVTLITCDGTFSGGGYSHRLVVRGTRTNLIPGAPSS